MGVQKIRARSDNSHLAWGYPPFLGMRTQGTFGCSQGNPWETSWGKSRSPGARLTVQGDSRRGGGPSAERGICVESPAGAEEHAGVGRVFCARLPALWP